MRLGDARDTVLMLLPMKPSIDSEYDYFSCGLRKEIHWLDLEKKASGLFVYLREGKVFQIESGTPRFRTPEGITLGGYPSKVRRHYPDLRTFVLRYSGGDVVGGRDLIYWVDQSRGIAFEFYFDRRAKKRLVLKVIVFDPITDFAPAGCVVEPQEWAELPPYSLEPG